MSEKPSITKSQSQIFAKLIANSPKIVLFHHINIDGDSIGCSYGLLQFLKAAFPQKELLWVADKDYIEKKFSFLKINYDDAIVDIDKDINRIDESWLALVGDVEQKARIHGFDVLQKAGKVACFDHHMPSLDFRTDYYWNDPSSKAASIQALSIIKQFKKRIPFTVAKYLIYGIMTDTINFSVIQNDIRPLKAMQSLISNYSSQEIQDFYRQISIQTKSSIIFKQWFYNNFAIKGSVGYAMVKNSDLQKLNLNAVEVGDQQNLLLNIEGTKVAAFFTEYYDLNYIRVEYLSTNIDIEKFAKAHGGGGHPFASGSLIRPIDWKKAEAILQDLITYVNGAK